MMNILLIIGAALFMVFFFGLCVFVHELGHFLAAKWRGLHIIAFSIGFKKIWAWKYKGVEYRIGCIPCGGYVDLPQIDSSADEKIVDGIKLPPAKPIDRIITAAAGPLFNILFGLLLGMAVWYYGVPRGTPKMAEITVETIEQNSPEYKAGLRIGDKIFKLNGKSFYTSWERFVSDIVFTVGEVKLTAKRGEQTVDINYVPAENPNYFGKEKIGYPFFRPAIPLTLYPQKNSVAEKAGVKAGDIMIELNGRKVSELNDINYILGLSGAEGVTMRVSRGKEIITVKGIMPKTETVSDNFKIGITYDPEASPPVVGQVLSASPAEKAGLLTGDQIININNTKIASGEQIPQFINDSKGRQIAVDIIRNGKPLSLQLTPIPYIVYDIGIDFTVIEHPTPYQQLYDVVAMTYNSLRGVGYNLANKMGMSEKSSTLKPRNFSGPLGIGTMIFRSVYNGSLIQGIYIIVIISFSLGLLNIMPLPVLDGGHIMLASLEMVFRRPLPAKVLQPINIAFIAFLISFMIYVSCYDVYRWMPTSKSAPAATVKNTDKETKPAAPAAPAKQEQNNVPAPKNP